MRPPRCEGRGGADDCGRRQPRACRARSLGELSIDRSAICATCRCTCQWVGVGQLAAHRHRDAGNRPPAIAWCATSASRGTCSPPARHLARDLDRVRCTVSSYDHHCRWLNTCISKTHNYRSACTGSSADAHGAIVLDRPHHAALLRPVSCAYGSSQCLLRAAPQQLAPAGPPPVSLCRPDRHVRRRCRRLRGCPCVGRTTIAAASGSSPL